VGVVQIFTPCRVIGMLGCFEEKLCLLLHGDSDRFRDVLKLLKEGNESIVRHASRKLWPIRTMEREYGRDLVDAKL